MSGEPVCTAMLMANTAANVITSYSIHYTKLSERVNWNDRHQQVIAPMNITSAKQLSAYLRDVRLAQKRSQGKVAERGGIRQDTVSSFELNPDATKLETLFKILAALDLSLDIKPRSESDDGSAASWPEEW